MSIKITEKPLHSSNHIKWNSIQKHSYRTTLLRILTLQPCQANNRSKHQQKFRLNFHIHQNFHIHRTISWKFCDGKMDDRFCRLCSALSINPYLNIFGEIGIEMRMVEILSEHFKCDVNKQTLLLLVENCSKYFIGMNFSFIFGKIRFLQQIHCRMWCVKCAGQQQKHFMTCINYQKRYKNNFSIHWWNWNMIRLMWRHQVTTRNPTTLMRLNFVYQK